MKRALLPLILIFSLISCQKELSIETGGNPDPGTNPNPPIGANCKLREILAIDSLTGRGLYSIQTFFKSGGLAEKVQVYDSIGSTVEFEAAFTYSANQDTIRLSGTEYFTVDNNKRVKSFQTIDYSGTTKDTLTYRYEYDGSGALSKKEVYITSLPIPAVRFSYVWSGGNLVSVAGVVAIPGINQKVLDATLEYDATKTAKNFIHILPDGFETSLFIMALDLGKKSTNVVKKITVTTYDETGALDEVLVSNYSDYKFSSDGYLTQWYVDGDLLGGSPFVEGTTKFNYFCR